MFRYDTLVIAVGSLTNDFGTPGVKEYAIALETASEAARFHRRLVNALMRAHAQPGKLRPEQLQVAIIGAGATGSSWPRSCTTRPANWWRMVSTGSIRTRTSGST